MRKRTEGRQKRGPYCSTLTDEQFAIASRLIGEGKSFLAIGGTNGLPSRRTLARLLRMREDGRQLVDKAKARWFALRPQLKDRAPRRKAITPEQFKLLSRVIAEGGVISDVAGALGLAHSAQAIKRLLVRTEEGRRLIETSVRNLTARRTERIGKARAKQIRRMDINAPARFEALLELVRNGRAPSTVRHVPGVMSGSTVWRYCRRDPERKRRLEEAIAQGQGKRVFPLSLKYSTEQFDATLAIIATTLGNVNEVNPPGLPGYFTIAHRARTDAALMAKLEAARAKRHALRAEAGLAALGVASIAEARPSALTPRKPAAGGSYFGRGVAYSAEAYASYLDKLRQDETATNLEEAQKLYWPGLPTFFSVKRRRRAEVSAVLREKGFIGGPRNRSLVCSEEAYAKAVQLVSSMSLLAFAAYRSENASERLPSVQAMKKRADRDPEFARLFYGARPRAEGSGQWHRYDDATYEEAIAKIGQSGWSAYVAEREVGVWPSLNSIYKRARLNPAFKARLRGKILERYSLKRQLKAYTAKRKVSKTTERPDGQLARLLLQQEAYQLADKFIPRHYDRADRDDIKSDIVAAFLAGDFEADAIGENARWFIREHFRSGVFSSGKFGSLDAPIYDDSDVAYIDRLSSDDYQHIG